MAKQLYIHYDSVSNHVLAKLIAFHLSAFHHSLKSLKIYPPLNGKSSLTLMMLILDLCGIKGTQKCVGISSRV